MTFFMYFNEWGKTCVSIVLILVQTIPQTLGSNFDGLQFPVNQSIHSFYIFLNPIKTFVDRGDSMEFMLRPSKNTVGTKQFLLSLAVHWYVAIMHKAPDGVVWSY